LTERVDLAVVGAGVAGLAAGVEALGRGLTVRVLETEGRSGGVVGTVAKDGYRFEEGPNAFLVKAPARAFLERAGLLDRVVAAGDEASKRFLFLDGELQEVPSSLASAVRSPLLSRSGKLRVLREPFVTAGDPTGESVAEFVTRRLGPEALERLVAPFLIGVYAGDERKLGAEAVFPALAEWERTRGSIVRGALAGMLRRGAPRGLRGSHSAPGGLGGLVAALTERLADRIQTGARVVSLARESGGWRIEAGGAETVLARAVVLAVPAWAAADLIRPLDSEAGELLGKIEYGPMVSVALAVDPAALRHPPRGFGFLVPREAGLDLLGGLFMSRVFPDRAPPGRELVMAMLGGARWPEAVTAPDDEILRRVGQGLERTLGQRAEPTPLGIQRWLRGVPQPGRDHPRQVRRLRELAAALGPLVLAGGYLDGIGLGDALGSGAGAAGEIADRLEASPS
jgi:oxygen-dependent protoporphyrinogen oxidase